MSTNFYVYGHYTADTNELFYIGKGKNRRAWSKKRSDWWKRKVNKHGHTVKILHDNLTEDEAFAKEIELIAESKRQGIQLVNTLPGGDGIPSEMWNDPEWKDKHRHAIQEKYKDPIYREKVKQVILKRVQDPKWREANRKQLEQLRNDPEYQRKLHEGLRRMHSDPEWKRKHTKALQRVTQTPEWRERNKAALRRLSQTPEWREHIKKLTDSQKKEFTMISPEGQIVTSRGIAEFARTYGLIAANVAKVLSKKRHHHRGWRLYEPNGEIIPFDTTHPSAKTYDGFVSPDGTVYRDIVNLTQFARDHNLTPPALYHVHSGKHIHHKGWKKYIPPTDIHTQFFDL